MKTLYAVESGEYSDHTVHFVTEHRELAEECAAALNAKRDFYHDEYTVSEIALVEAVEEARPVPMYYAWVDMNGDPLEEHRPSSVQSRYPFDLEAAQEHAHPMTGGRGVGACSPHSPEAALKAARDYLARFKAEREGLT